MSNHALSLTLAVIISTTTVFSQQNFEIVPAGIFRAPIFYGRKLGRL